MPIATIKIAGSYHLMPKRILVADGKEYYVLGHLKIDYCAQGMVNRGREQERHVQRVVGSGEGKERKEDGPPKSWGNG